MACTNCSTTSGNAPGCKSEGACSSGNCGKMSDINWLSNMSLPDGQDPYDILEVRFRVSGAFWCESCDVLSRESHAVHCPDAPAEVWSRVFVRDVYMAYRIARAAAAAKGPVLAVVCPAMLASKGQLRPCSCRLLLQESVG